MYELQAGIAQALAVFPQAPVFLQPGKAARGDPALGHDFERMQITALGNLHRDMFTRNGLHTLCKRLARASTVAQQALYLAQGRLAALKHAPCYLAVGHVRRGHHHRKPCVSTTTWRLMPETFFTRVMALVHGNMQMLLHISCVS